MRWIKFYLFVGIISGAFSLTTYGQNLAMQDIDQYNVKWQSQSNNSSESMPCGGGNIGANIWVEKNDVFLYVTQSGFFDENGIFPKAGRIRLTLLPNPFEEGAFRQELILKKGFIEIEGRKNKHIVKIKIWTDVFNPSVHVDVKSNIRINATAAYETWRYQDYQWADNREFRASSAYIGAPVKPVIYKDSVYFAKNDVMFYHRNRKETLFDLTVHQQGLDSIKSKLWNPLANRTFGGCMSAKGMIPAGYQTGKYGANSFKAWKLKTNRSVNNIHLRLTLLNQQSADINEWQNTLKAVAAKSAVNVAANEKKNLLWWNNFWKRSFIFINPDRPDTSSAVWQVGRNYNLFRYQLGCNAFGTFPTKFNGGLFTFDPNYVDKNHIGTPDHRDWGGTTHTAQNQRLVYWPMLKSGDFEMMAPQLDFYLNALKNAELRTKVYWGHGGASFTEQIELFGLPNASEYGWNRPADFPKGVEYNLWLEYLWDTSLEFCQMALEKQRYSGENISKYIPLIESCLTFFYEHYQKESLKRTLEPFDGNNKLIIYPGSATETYKMTYNSSSTIAGLKTVLGNLINLPEEYLTIKQRSHWQEVLTHIPEIPTMYKNGKQIIAPAVAWDRRPNIELPQLYPVFPWGIYGLHKKDLQIAIDTWNYGADSPDQKNYISWHQDAIFCARLGLTQQAAEIEIQKLRNSQRRYPTFWGPGHDWVPDHNWGGSGMIGLQEMLMQCDDKKIYLFPAWPKQWDVHFKLHAPYNTTVEVTWEKGLIKNIEVIPKIRLKDIIMPAG